MTIRDKINNLQNNVWYNVQGRLEFLENNKIKITPEKPEGGFVIVEEKSVNHDYILPVGNSAVLNHLSTYTVPIKEGSSVEMYYGSVNHTFTLDASERPFYINTTDEKIVFLPPQVSNDAQSDSCAAAVIVAYEWCCHTNNDIDGLYGFVTCGHNWHIDACCPHA